MAAAAPPSEASPSSVSGCTSSALAAGDRVGEAGDDPDIGALHGGVGQEVDARPVDQRVAAASREDEGAVGELGRERAGHVAERLEIGRMEVDDEPVRGERAIRGGQPLGLHGALDPPLQLDRLEACPEQARGRTLEEAFEEPLDGGQRRHGRSRSLAGGSRWTPVMAPSPPGTIRSTTEVPPAEGRESPCGILSPLFEPVRPLNTSSAHPGVLMPEDPHRIILRTLRYPLHVRIRGPEGRQASRG